MLVRRSARRCATLALKEGRACLAPALPCRGVLHHEGVEQRPGQYLGIERIGPGRGHQLAKLAHAPFLKRLGLVGKGFEFQIKVAGFAHRKVFHEVTMPR